MWTAHAMTRWIGTAEKAAFIGTSSTAASMLASWRSARRLAYVDDDIARHDWPTGSSLRSDRAGAQAGLSTAYGSRTGTSFQVKTVASPGGNPGTL
jgi:hypothetical protein